MCVGITLPPSNRKTVAEKLITIVSKKASKIPNFRKRINEGAIPLQPSCRRWSVCRLSGLQFCPTFNLATAGQLSQNWQIIGHMLGYVRAAKPWSIFPSGLERHVLPCLHCLALATKGKRYHFSWKARSNSAT